MLPLTKKNIVIGPPAWLRTVAAILTVNRSIDCQDVGAHV